MGKGMHFTDEFKQNAVAQIVERGYEVSGSRSAQSHFTLGKHTNKAMLTLVDYEAR